MTALIRTEGEEGKGINQADFTVALFEGTNKFYQCSKCLMCPDTCSSLCFKKFPLFEISLPDAFPYPNWKFGSAPCVFFWRCLEEPMITEGSLVNLGEESYPLVRRVPNQETSHSTAVSKM